MIVLFGDSWARQPYYHSEESGAQGYAHWHYKHITVASDVNIWLHHFFKQHSSLNQADFGNTTKLIIQDLCHFKNIARISQPLKYVIFQTDPLRIFAPRMDYTDYNIVWPRFLEWATINEFDLESSTIAQLTEKIYNQWYACLKGFEQQEQLEQNSKTQLFLVGGVSKTHPTVIQHNLKVVIPSITEYFGFDKDLVFENRASLACLVNFWCRNVSAHQSHCLRQEWKHLDNLLEDKEQFWIDNPQWFAGRHMTANAMAQVAQKIESVVAN